MMSWRSAASLLRSADLSVENLMDTHHTGTEAMHEDGTPGQTRQTQEERRLLFSPVERQGAGLQGRFQGGALGRRRVLCQLFDELFHTHGGFAFGLWRQEVWTGTRCSRRGGGRV